MSMQARPRSSGREPLPAALPPETRTVGQLVAESVQFYRANFWRCLPLGLPFAIDDQIFTGTTHARAVVATAVGAVLLTVAYIAATLLVAGTRAGARELGTAFVAGFLAYVPFAFLVLLFILPGLAWLALVGLVVPVVLIERLSFRAAFARAVRLARADFVHALGSLATLTILFVLVRLVLFLLLRGFGDAADRAAIFLADLVLSPIVFVGAALLYFDQAARVVESRPRP
jgi:hypothetical protein